MNQTILSGVSQGVGGFITSQTGHCQLTSVKLTGLRWPVRTAKTNRPATVPLRRVGLRFKLKNDAEYPIYRNDRPFGAPLA